jgi:hypothetical protein
MNPRMARIYLHQFSAQDGMGHCRPEVSLRKRKLGNREDYGKEVR